jgi:hypothetical protein
VSQTSPMRQDFVFAARTASVGARGQASTGHHPRQPGDLTIRAQPVADLVGQVEASPMSQKAVPRRRRIGQVRSPAYPNVDDARLRVDVRVGRGVTAREADRLPFGVPREPSVGVAAALIRVHQMSPQSSASDSAALSPKPKSRSSQSQASAGWVRAVGAEAMDAESADSQMSLR